MVWYFSRAQEAKIINGKQMAADIQKEIRNNINKYVAEGKRPPCLKAVLVGEDPASHTYVKNKMLAAADVGKATENPPCIHMKIIFVKISQQ